MMRFDVSESEIVKMPSKVAKLEECKLEGDEVTHLPTGKKYRAYPGMPGIENEDMVDVGDYREYEIRAIAEQMLADRPKKD